MTAEWVDCIFLWNSSIIEKKLVRNTMLEESRTVLSDISSNVWGTANKTFSSTQTWLPAIKRAYTLGLSKLAESFNHNCQTLLKEASADWPDATAFMAACDEERKHCNNRIREKAKLFLDMMAEDDPVKLEDAAKLIPTVVAMHASKLEQVKLSVTNFFAEQDNRLSTNREGAGLIAEMDGMATQLRDKLDDLRLKIASDTEEAKSMEERKRKADEEKQDKTQRECRNFMCGQRRPISEMTACPHTQAHDKKTGYWFCNVDKNGNGKDCAAALEAHKSAGKCKAFK